MGMMAEPKVREKFWVTDPPGVYTDENIGGQTLLMIFTNRSKLKAYYRDTPGLPDPTEVEVISKRWGYIKKACENLGYNGVTIDAHAGIARIIIFDSSRLPNIEPIDVPGRPT